MGKLQQSGDMACSVKCLWRLKTVVLLVACAPIRTAACTKRRDRLFAAEQLGFGSATDPLHTYLTQTDLATPLAGRDK